MENDLKAAKLYLEYWQAGEAGLPNQLQEEARLRSLIMDLGYPDPEKIVFDNEAMPWIKWQDPNFDWVTWNTEYLAEEGYL